MIVFHLTQWLQLRRVCAGVKFSQHSSQYKSYTPSTSVVTIFAQRNNHFDDNSNNSTIWRHQKVNKLLRAVCLMPLNLSSALVASTRHSYTTVPFKKMSFTTLLQMDQNSRQLGSYKHLVRSQIIDVNCMKEMTTATI